MSEIESSISKNKKIDLSRYAITPWRKASRYAKKTGSRPPRNIKEDRGALNRGEDRIQPSSDFTKLFYPSYWTYVCNQAYRSRNCVTGDCDPARSASRRAPVRDGRAGVRHNRNPNTPPPNWFFNPSPRNPFFYSNCYRPHFDSSQQQGFYTFAEYGSSQQTHWFAQLSQDEVVPETQPPTDAGPSTQPTQRRRHKKKQVGDTEPVVVAPNRLEKWSPEEEFLLSKAWVDVSEDTIVDTRLMLRRKCKTLDRGRGGIVVLPAAVGQNLSTVVKGAAFAYDV
ncbi:hypothetical protein E3N88_04892 [Mikania micrantha]|uniref:Uncharacterized protein n=1 Tax=Mikania micrantha TaxID=192012 RepID=A0A5N6PVQ9_9ASTR|nr:hypothetical protein E3N88_04892 [Mikania micrantha]